VSKSQLAAYKYNHYHVVQRRIRPVLLKTTVWTFVWLAVCLVGLKVTGKLSLDNPADLLFAGLAFLAIFGISVLVRSSPKKQILVGPRYLICGAEILYYANVVSGNLDSNHGVLRLATASGQEFRLEKNRFPTNARKDFKIELNKNAKFAKVSGKILTKVRKFSPQAQITNFTR
jgi:hypothetical protein